MIKFENIDKNAFFDSNITEDELVLYISFIAIGLKILFSIINVFLKKSYFLLNHYKLFTTIDILSNFVVLTILIINIYNYVTIVDLFEVWDNDYSFIENIKELVIEDSNKTLLFFATILINIPAIIKFAIYFTRYFVIIAGSYVFIPATLLIVYKYISSESGYFYEYKDYNSQFFIIRLRLIDDKDYKRSIILSRVLKVLIVGGIIYLLALLLIGYFIFENIDGPLGLLIALIPVFYVWNALYLSRKLTNRALNKSSKKIDDTYKTKFELLAEVGKERREKEKREYGEKAGYRKKNIESNEKKKKK